MKFIVDDATLLWKAVSRVLAATPRNTMGTELLAVCLETLNGKLYAHRYADSNYAECVVDIELIEDGKVIVADATVFQYLYGRFEFHDKGNKLYIKDLSNPKNNTDLLLSSTDPMMYSRISHDGVVTRPVNTDLYRGLWVSKGEEHLYGFGVIDGADVITTNNYNIVLVTNDEVLIDGVVTVPTEFLKVAKIGTELGLDGNKVWLVDDGNTALANADHQPFAYYSTTMDKPYNNARGYFRQGIMSKLSDNNPNVTLDTVEFLSLMEFIAYMSTDKVYRNGYCVMTLKDGELTVSNLNRTAGDATRIIKATESIGSFEVVQYPRMLIDAVRSMSDEHITIEAWYNEHFDAYALIIRGEHIISFIPCSNKKGQ